MIDGTAMPRVKSGAPRALAVTGAQRSATLPDAPTIAESGVPGFVFASWHGFFFPAGVASKIVRRVNGAVNEILKDPAIKARFAELNIDLVGGTAKHFASFVRGEAEKMAKLVEISGARD